MLTIIDGLLLLAGIAAGAAISHARLKARMAADHPAGPKGSAAIADEIREEREQVLAGMRRGADKRSARK